MSHSLKSCIYGKIRGYTDKFMENGIKDSFILVQDIWNYMYEPTLLSLQQMPIMAFLHGFLLYQPLISFPTNILKYPSIYYFNKTLYFMKRETHNSAILCFFIFWKKINISNSYPLKPVLYFRLNNFDLKWLVQRECKFRLFSIYLKPKNMYSVIRRNLKI